MMLKVNEARNLVAERNEKRMMAIRNEANRICDSEISLAIENMAKKGISWVDYIIDPRFFNASETKKCVEEVIKILESNGYTITDNENKEIKLPQATGIAYPPIEIRIQW